MKILSLYRPRLLVLMLLIFLVSCSDSSTNNASDNTADTQAKSSQEQATDNNSGQLGPFRITGIDEALLQGKPVISLNFSEPLDAFRSYNKWLSVYNDKGRKLVVSWVLSSDGKSLYFPDIDARKTYSIDVLPGIVAKNKQLLKKGERLSITTKHMQAFAAFSGNGRIIPAGTQAGLPVRSVNVDSIQVDYFKVPVEYLQRLLTQFYTASSRSSYSIDRITSNSLFVYSANYELANDLNRPLESKLPLDKKITDVPGVYFAVIKRNGIYEYNFPMTYFTVSDIGLHLRQYKNTWSVFTSELASGKANADVEIRVLDQQGYIISDGKSNDQGMLDMTMPATNDARLLLALKDKHMAVLRLTGPALDISDFDLPRREFKQREYFIFGPRDAYRPGELLQFSALLRNYDGQLIAAAPATATLLRPDGSVANRQTLAVEKNGYYQYRYQLADSDSTGQWSLQLSLDDDEDSGTAKAFLIEDFMPERIRMRFSEQDKTMLSLAELQKLNVHAEYLYGSPAAGNTLETQVSIYPARSPFSALKDFEFGKANKNTQAQLFYLDKKNLNENGQGVITLDKWVLNAIAKIQGPVVLDFQSSVAESGGRPVKRDLLLYSWQKGVWPGIKAGFDTEENTLVNQEVSFSLIASDEKGVAIDGRQLSVELINLNRDSYWEYDENDGWVYEHVDDPQRTWEQKVVSKSSPLAISVPVNKGYYQLRVTDIDGNTSTTDFSIGQDWWAYEDIEAAARPDKITVTLDQPYYKDGDTIKVQLQSPRPGSGFLLVENSDGILFSKRIDLAEDAQEFAIKIPADDANWQRHDVRIVSMIVQPEQQAKHGVAMRSLGMQVIPLDRTDKKVTLEIDAPEKVEPQTILKLKLSSEQADANMMVTVSAVDQGVLSVTDFETPDAFSYFYQQRRAEVDARDNFSDVLHVKDLAFARQRFGGDSDKLSRAGDLARSTVLIVSLFEGPVSFDDKGIAELEFEMPDFNGAVRLMVTAYADDKFGSADAEVLVKAPVVTQLSLPRFAAYGDQTQLTLDIQNTLEQTQDLTLNWQLDGAELQDPQQLSSTLQLAKDQKQILRLPVNITRSSGVAEIQLHVKSEGSDFTRNWSLGLRPAYPAVSFQKTEYIGADMSASVDSEWLQQKLDETLQLRLSISPYPSLNTAEQWRSLLQYPYGCLEQTTSRARPLAVADDALRQRWQVSLPDDMDRVKAVQEAINRLQTMQRLRGGFGLWNAHSPEEYWLTAYVTDFLLTAKDKGFQVPAVMLDSAMKRLQVYVNDNRLHAGSDGYGDRLHYRFAYRSYAAYVLAKQAKAPLGTLRQWLDTYSNESKSSLPLVHLAIALKLQGDGERAAKAVALAAGLSRKQDLYLGDYGSSIRDNALFLALNIKYKLSLEKVDERLIKLSEDIYRRSYLSTQERDAILQLALALDTTEEGNSWSAKLTMAAEEKVLESTGKWSKVIKGADAATASIEITGEQKLFVSQTLVAHPLQAPEKSFKGFSIRREWFDSNGKAITSSEFQSGDFVIVRLLVTADKRSPDAMIVDLLPAGFELENPGLQHSTPLSRFVIDGKKIKPLDEQYPARLKHHEYRDDRFVAAVDLRAGSTMELTYLMRASTPGHYQVPSAYVEDMYQPELRGLGVPFDAITITAAQ